MVSVGDEFGRLTVVELEKTLIEWSEELGIKYNVLQLRLQRGWSVERTLTQPVRR